MELASHPLPLRAVRIEDPFWAPEMELIRRTVLPYQWDILNDRVPGAAPSFCIHNFRAAARMNREKAAAGSHYQPPAYTFRGFEALPEDPAHPDPDKFYGFVFQDSDLAKWIEAVAASLVRCPDPALEKTADEAIELICAAQQENGYLDTYYIINGQDRVFTNLRDHHELYCFGHLAEAAVAYHQATGKTRLLDAVCRYADYIDSRFNEENGDCKGYPGHEIAEMALFRLYEETGTARYKALAQLFLDRRGQQPYYFDREEAAKEEPKLAGERYQYYQAHQPVRLQREAIGHAVRAMYLYSGMADDARLTGDTALRDACRALWRDVTRRKMYVTGSVGSTATGEAFTFPYDLPPDTAYAETCAAIGLVFFARRMLELEPLAEYADVMERAIYNGVLSGISADGKSFFYVNPLAVRPDACAGDPRKSHVKPVRQKWFGCACCPPNLARLISSLGQYAYTASDRCLFVHLYLGGSARLELPEGSVTVQVSARLPESGKVAFGFSGCTGDRFTVAVRVPGWCGGQYLATACEDAEQVFRDGYLYLTKAWADTDHFTVDFAMPARLIHADPRVWAVAGRVCVARGPLIYCLEEADNSDALHLCHIRPDRPLTVRMGESVPGRRLPLIDAEGLRDPLPPTADSLYADYTPTAADPVTLHFLPYHLWANRGIGEMTVWVPLAPPSAGSSVQ